MMSRSSTVAVRSVLGHAARGGAAADVMAFFHGGIIPNSKGLKSEIVTRMWLRPVVGSRNASTVALGDKPQEKGGGSSGSAAGSGGNDKKEKGIGGYWGIETPKVTKEDGSELEEYKEKYKGPIDLKKYQNVHILLHCGRGTELYG